MLVVDLREKWVVVMVAGNQKGPGLVVEGVKRGRREGREGEGG